MPCPNGPPSRGWHTGPGHTEGILAGQRGCRVFGVAMPGDACRVFQIVTMYPTGT